MGSQIQWCVRHGTGGRLDTAICGNGVVEGDEACDDGMIRYRRLSEYLETARCGDGIVQEGQEACDDGNETDGDECRNNCALQPVEMVSFRTA